MGSFQLISRAFVIPALSYFYPVSPAHSSCVKLCTCQRQHVISKVGFETMSLFLKISRRFCHSSSQTRPDTHSDWAFHSRYLLFRCVISLPAFLFCFSNLKHRHRIATNFEVVLLWQFIPGKRFFCG